MSSLSAQSKVKNMSEFMYVINPADEEPIMLIDKHIGIDSELGYGVIGAIFQRELLALDVMKKKRIQVWINSPGGGVVDGYDIYHAILVTKTPVDTICTGIAASIAGVIFQAGRKRIMMDYSKLMYHDPYNDDGSTDKALEPIRQSLATMIATRSGKSEEEVSKMMQRTTWIGAEEAEETGFCDEIQPSSELNQKYKVKSNLLNIADTQLLWKESNKVLNSILKPTKNKMEDYSKVNNKLKLNADASIESTIEAIEAIQNKANKAEEDCTKAESDAEDLRAKLKKAEEDVDSYKKALKKMEDEKAEEDKKNAIKKAEEDKKEEEAKKLSAKNLIADFVTKGKIANKPEVINLWEGKAYDDFEGVKSMIGSLSPNAKAATIAVNEERQLPQLGMTMARVMAQNRASLIDK